MEKLLELVSFEATEKSGESVHIDAAYVKKHLGQLADDEDFARYIL
jgi:ATP-dependent HslUV protease ATP-binding subunit HslU